MKKTIKENKKNKEKKLEERGILIKIINPFRCIWLLGEGVGGEGGGGGGQY